MSRYLITAALPYANGPVHIGHLAGCYIPADIYARYLRLKGEDVKFICGSDEHGVPITIKARQLGVSPQDVVDKYHTIMRDAFFQFGISFDHYSRTSAPIHHRTASEFFKTLYDKGVFIEETTQQFYDEEAKQFLADRYITGTCPRCGYENAYGDQCENCGSSLNPTDLINPKSKLSGKTPVLKPTKNWFLPMDKIQKSKEFQEYIKRFEHWKLNISGQCASWLNEGLQPRAMTRDLDWGVKVPLPDAEGKVLYVWFDAPIGYISASKEFMPNDWEKYWKQQPDEKDNPTLIHFIGKDNIVFHAIIFPMMLMTHGGYVLPSNVPANEFLNLEGDKISTSRNWAVWLHEYLEDFPGREDELRYVLTSIAPETKDSEFTWKDFQARVENELANTLGNYIKRVVDLINSKFDGIVPPYTQNNKGNSTDGLENDFIKTGFSGGSVEHYIEQFQFKDAMFEIMRIAREGNQQLQNAKPWEDFANKKIEAGNVLHNAIYRCRLIASLVRPILPNLSKNIFKQLNLNPDEHNIFKPSHIKLIKFEKDIPPNHKINKSEILIEKFKPGEIEKQIQKLHDKKAMNSQQNITSVEETLKAQLAETTFDDFSKMDIRVATILEAERVPKTDKLLKLLLDTGIDKRTVVSGIAAYYDPEKIIGQKVVMLANLAPRKIKGIESKGMILMAENEKGELSFISPQKDVITNGSTVK